ncbi:undecaprenyl-diphosphatase [Candidatus Falkowbacteria bacterium HGW-Falkowbacteria-1]|jgi:undecaprenyl-diphosphatase|uniref:Undecaprenyl-diphosphatase n=1 Tax=Candidatus Falkowbacteria bacterium HGW-Falkowbacteria-1 TaxID=2013768 RepID=A0A2N2E9J5_9BACT|nr:MAG: undecaprenyl-diphosphatase [Candidatus Falkowbacteria bacterium HGW-Falkowbacteria-1]
MIEYFYFKSLLLGIIQGFTEFLPISSTAHLLVGAQLLKMELNDFTKSFIIIIQLASILAVVFLYWKKIINNFLSYFKKILIAFIPTAVLGLVFYKIVKNFFQESFLIISLALFLGGIAIIFLENYYENRKKAVKSVEQKDFIDEISYKKCFYIGLFQSIAMIPGVSRSAATIFGGLFLGISRRAIVEFSFLLAIPTMAAASGLDLIKSGFSFSREELIFLIIGFIVSFLVAIVSIKFLLNFIKKNNFKVFAWYRILIGLLIFFTFVLI